MSASETANYAGRMASIRRSRTRLQHRRQPLGTSGASGGHRRSVGRGARRGLHAHKGSPRSVPTKPAYVELSFDGGVPVAINGVEMPILDLIGSLSIIAGAHGVGRIDMVENRLPEPKRARSTKRRPQSCCMPRIRNCRRWCVDHGRRPLCTGRQPAVRRHHLQWPLVRAASRGARRLHRQVQERVTGVIRMKLFKGDCRVVGRKSPFAPLRIGTPATCPSTTASSMTTLWSGRFDAPPDPAAFEFGEVIQLRSPAVRRRRHRQHRLGARAGAGRRPAARRSGPDRKSPERHPRARGDRDPPFVDGDDEDVHSFVERVLVERVGDAGRRLHTGRSRNEQVSLDLRLYLMRRIPLLQGAVAASSRRWPSRPLRWRRADAGVYTLPGGTAGAGRALLPRPCGRVATRLRPVGGGPPRSGCAHARVGRHCGHQLRRRCPRARRRPRLLARRRQQHRRLVRSRFRGDRFTTRAR